MFHGAAPITFENAKKLRRQMTKSEKVLWNCLRKRQLNDYRFKSQHPIGDYIVDFYCHAAKLVIEVDGEIHLRKEQMEYDYIRTQELNELGLKVLRFTNTQVINKLENVIDEIKTILKK